MRRHTLVNGLGRAGAGARSGWRMDNLVQQVMGPLYSLGDGKSIIQALVRTQTPLRSVCAAQLYR